VIDAYCELKELNRSYHLLLRWLGFRATYLVVDHAERFAGKSAYNLRRGFLLAVESITSQSNKPLILSIRAGFLMAGRRRWQGDRYCQILHARRRRRGVDQRHGCDLFHRRLVLANLGVIGLYLGKVFNEVKERPLYLIRDAVNFRVESETPRKQRIDMQLNVIQYFENGAARHSRDRVAIVDKDRSLRSPNWSTGRSSARRGSFSALTCCASLLRCSCRKVRRSSSPISASSTAAISTSTWTCIHRRSESGDSGPDPAGSDHHEPEHGREARPAGRPAAFHRGNLR